MDPKTQSLASLASGQGRFFFDKEDFAEQVEQERGGPDF